jgi:hypothetical protein
MVTLEPVTHAYLLGLRSDAKALCDGARRLRFQADEVRAASRQTRADAEHRYAMHVAASVKRVGDGG